jgi:hypothetical protein
MSTTDLDFADLDELAEMLVANGVRSASPDPAKVIVPGVWLNPRTISLDNLAGCTIRVDLVLVVADQGYRQSMPALAALFNEVKNALEAAGLGGPDDDTRVISVVLPGSTQALPALSVPLDLLTTHEETPCPSRPTSSAPAP